jgi:hypothetical protein
MKSIEKEKLSMIERGGWIVIKDKAQNYFKSQYHQPTNEKDLELFAKQVLEEFIEKLEKHKRAVVWNYGLDDVIFFDKLKELKELYECRDDQSDSDESHGE